MPRSLEVTLFGNLGIIAFIFTVTKVTLGVPEVSIESMTTKSICT